MEPGVVAVLVAVVAVDAVAAAAAVGGHVSFVGLVVHGGVADVD